MISKSIFRAYDIRGIYPQEINEEAVLVIAQTLARYFSAEGGSTSGGKKGKIVIGYDARLSSLQLYKALLRGLKIENYKLKIENCGLITTPMMYFLVNHLKAVGGIMITASHNPKKYNGMKVVGRKAVPISGEEIYRLIYDDR